MNYKGVYRGINLVYHGDQQQLEYNCVVRPGASPGVIRPEFGEWTSAIARVHREQVDSS